MTMQAADHQREIRVFLSSTFRDMDAERDQLLQHVFPRFRQECSARDVGFTEIDLRWGVTEEASRNGRTVEICLAEIDRCRAYPPFFIGFLGDRYGWVPAPDDLAAYWESHAGSPYAAPIRAALAQGHSVTELEMRFGVLDAPERYAQAHFFLRADALTAQLARHDRGGPAAFHDDGGSKLAALKDALRATGRVQMDGYTDVAAFGERVLALLREALDTLYPAAAVPSPLQQRLTMHRRFAASRQRSYVPLPAMRSAVAAALQDAAPVLLSGASGLGKSALMADLAAWLPQGQPGGTAFVHFCGADGNRTLDGWRDDLLQQLGQPDPAGERPAGDAQWRDLLTRLARLAERTHGGPVWLLLDAIDQLAQPDEALRELTRQPWPAGVRLVVSSVPQAVPPQGYTVVALAAPDAAQRRSIIAAFTADYRKELPAALVDRLATDERSASPLYLRMVLEELRLHSRHESLGENVDDMLALAGPEELFASLLRRWDRDYGDLRHPRLVSQLAGLLALARDGLDEVAMAELLAIAGDPVVNGAPRLPAALLAPVLAVLRPYLLRHGGRESLLHLALQRGARPADPLAARMTISTHSNRGLGHNSAECIYQFLQASREMPDSQPVRRGLYQALEPLSTIFWLQYDHGLLREALLALGAHGQRDDTPAAALGRSWAQQLGSWHRPAGWRTRLMRWARRQPDNTATREELAHQLAHQLDLTQFLLGSLYDWQFFRTALPLARQMTTLAGGVDADVSARAVNLLALLEMGSGNVQAATDLFDGIAGQHDNAALTVNRALALSQQGRLHEARPIAEQGVAAMRAMDPVPTASLAAALNTLGTIRVDLGDWLAALPVLEEAVALQRQVRPPDVPALLPKLRSLATAQRLAGRYGEAEVLLDEGLELVRLHRLQDNAESDHLRSELGQVYLEQGRTALALSTLSDAAAGLRRALGPDHYFLGNTLNGLGMAYQGLQRHEPAQQALQQALAILRKALHEPHPMIATVLNNLGQVEQDLDHPDAAAQHYEAALAQANAIAPGGSQMAATIGNNLASLAWRSGRHDEAEARHRDTLALRRRILPAGHPDITNSLYNLGLLLCELGRLDEALPLLEEMLQDQQSRADAAEAAEAADAQYAMALLIVATVRFANGRFDGAADALAEALPHILPPIADGELQAMLPAALATLNQLAEQYQTAGPQERLGTVLELALAYARLAAPAPSAEVGSALTRLGEYHLGRREPAKAAALLEQAVAMLRTVHPQGSYPLTFAMFKLSDAHSATSRPGSAALLMQEATAWMHAQQPQS